MSGLDHARQNLINLVLSHSRLAGAVKPALDYLDRLAELRGLSDETATQPCYTCKGTGIIYGMGDTHTCPTCNGPGRLLTPSAREIIARLPLAFLRKYRAQIDAP